MAEKAMHWLMGYLLISPIRKIKQSPEKIITPYIKKGFRVLDAGCAMGYFSIPMAKLTGKTGKVFCVDAQPQMLNVLKKRAVKHKVDDIIVPSQCSFTSLEISNLINSIDFALVFAIVHEVPDRVNFFREVYSALKPGSKCLFAEPTGHETLEGFQKSVKIAEDIGFKKLDELKIYNSYSVLLEKKP